MQSPNTLTDLFRAHGRKITAQRQCIFRALEDDVTHPSAEHVHEKVRHEMPNVSLKTVSARFDPHVETVHHHLVCRSCGKVRDVAADFPGLRVPRRAGQGFAVDSAEVVFRGLCQECKRSQQ
jgi:Fe2+ or Zn2+ uptake regulation protein